MSHEPKIAALIALEEGLLSPPGRRRMERHLASCETCRGARASVRALETLTSEARDQKWPEPRWDKMELALAREARSVVHATKQEQQTARFAISGMLAAAAAIVFVVWQVGESADEPRHPVAAPVVAQVESDGATIEGNVIAVAGDVRVAGIAVQPGTTLHEGERLEVAATGARVHARLATDTGLVALPGTTVDFDRLREHGIVLGLATGEVASQVRHLESGERYEVRAGDYTVRVRGTRFSVRRLGDEVAVTVDEGFVEVSDATAVLAVVHAPGTWISSPDIAGTPLGGVAAPRGLAEASAQWPLVTFPAFPNIGSWLIDGAPFEAGGILRTRAPVGPLPVIATDLRGIPMSFMLEVGDDGTTLDASRLHFDLGARPVPRGGDLTRADFDPVIRAGTDGIQRCYHSWAQRYAPDLSLDVTLRVTLDATGHVTRSTVDLGGAHVPNPQWLGECIEPKVASWEFPPPHATQTFAQAMHLTP